MKNKTRRSTGEIAGRVCRSNVRRGNLHNVWQHVKENIYEEKYGCEKCGKIIKPRGEGKQGGERMEGYKFDVK